MYERSEVNGASFITRGKSPEVFQPIETPLDAVSMFVDGRIVGDGDLASAVGRDDRLGIHGLDRGPQGIAVIGFVAQYGFACMAFEKRRCLRDVTDLTGRYNETQWTAERIGQHVDLGGQSTSGTPQRLTIFARAALAATLIATASAAPSYAFTPGSIQTINVSSSKGSGQIDQVYQPNTGSAKHTRVCLVNATNTTKIFTHGIPGINPLKATAGGPELCQFLVVDAGGFRPARQRRASADQRHDGDVAESVQGRDRHLLLEVSVPRANLFHHVRADPCATGPVVWHCLCPHFAWSGGSIRAPSSSEPALPTLRASVS